jgi:Na+-transporting NADH:ubiquinone oxidoreductase subunit B
VAKLIDRVRKLYHEPGSPLHKVWPLFDALETFLFTPDRTTPPGGPHVRDYIDLKRTMWTVIVALLPCVAFAVWNVGHQHFASVAGLAGERGSYAAGWLQRLVMGGDYAPDVAAPGLWDKLLFGLQQMGPIIFVSYFVGLNIEAVFSIIRKEEVSEGYLVSGILIALIVPASIPLWQLAVGVAFAVVLAKEVFGGTGMNVFNPAMMCRAFLFFAFPAQMSGDFVWVAGNQHPGGNPSHLIDGFSAPTPLAVAKVAGADASARLAEHYSHWEMFLGTIPGSAGETSKLCVLIGAAILILTGVGSWRVMVAGVLGVLVSATALKLLLPATHGGPVALAPWEHLLCGGFLFGIVFMATDPVSSPETRSGKWVYGALIGFVTVLVRAINPAYPEGTMLSILLLNAFAPTIDHFIVAANIRRRQVRLEH